MLRIFLFLLFFFTLTDTDAYVYYWTGGSGDWSNLNNWASSSGGSTRFTVIPGSQDTVIFDDNSFSGNQDTVYLPDIAYCGSLLYQSSNNALIAPVNQSVKLNIYIDLVLNRNVTLHNQINLAVTANANYSNQIRLDHTVIPLLSLDGPGNWLLSDTADIRYLSLYRGRLRINADSLRISQISRPQLNPPGITIECLSKFIYIGKAMLSQDSFLAVNSTLVDLELLSLWNSASYAEIKCIVPLKGLYSYSPSIPIGKIGKIISNDVNIGVPYYSKLTIDSILLSGLSNIAFSSSTANVSYISGQGSCTHLIKVEGSTNYPVQFPASFVQDLSYCSFKNVQFATTQNIPYSADLGGNSGINFVNERTAKKLYWVGGRGSMEDSSHWALTSGGTPYNCLPIGCDTVIFDDSSFSQSDTVFSEHSQEYGGLYIKSTKLLSLSMSPGQRLTLLGNIFILVNTSALVDGNVWFDINTDCQGIFNGSVIHSVTYYGNGHEIHFPEGSLSFNHLIVFGSLDLSNKSVHVDYLTLSYRTGTTLNLSNTVLDVNSGNINFNNTPSLLSVSGLQLYGHDLLNLYSSNSLTIPFVKMKNSTTSNLEGSLSVTGIAINYLELEGHLAMYANSLQTDTVFIQPDSRIRVNTNYSKWSITKRFDAVGTCTKTIFLYNYKELNRPVQIQLFTSTNYNLH
ncbi:MAG: hypothetical protein GC180_08750 [Bacteroidetes bacterium]|nr:hypothetical protein [Bacteroidota bacterium]